MIISRCSIALLAISAGLLPASANRRMGRRHLQDGEPVDSDSQLNVTDIVGIADVIEEDDKSGKSSKSDDDARQTAKDFYQYVDSNLILTGIYGGIPGKRKPDKGVTFVEALRYSVLNKCSLTPIRDDFELQQVQTVLATAVSTGQAQVTNPTDFAWVGVAKDPMTTKDSSKNPSIGGKLCRAGSWKNLYDDSDLGGYETAPCAWAMPDKCPGGCWLENVMGNKANILDDYLDDSSGEPNNVGYNRLQTKALMNASSLRLFDAHEGQIEQAKGAIYLRKLK